MNQCEYCECFKECHSIFDSIQLIYILIVTLNELMQSFSLNAIHELAIQKLICLTSSVIILTAKIIPDTKTNGIGHCMRFNTNFLSGN